MIYNDKNDDILIIIITWNWFYQLWTKTIEWTNK